MHKANGVSVVVQLHPKQKAVVARAGEFDPQIRVLMEDAALKREWAAMARRDVPRAARHMAARR